MVGYTLQALQADWVALAEWRFGFGIFQYCYLVSRIPLTNDRSIKMAQTSVGNYHVCYLVAKFSNSRVLRRTYYDVTVKHVIY